MRIFGTAALGLILAIPVALATAPAHAQDQGNGVLGQMQRLINPNDHSQDAYQRGREDQARQEQARREERWREQHAQRDSDHYGDHYGRPYPDQRGYSNGPPPPPPPAYANGPYYGH